MTITQIRPFIFLIAFTFLYLLQKVIPSFKVKDHTRIIHNWYVFILSILIVRAFFPGGIGADLDKIFNMDIFLSFKSYPFWLDLLLSVIVFDLAIYWQHRLFHKVNLFWRFHKVHHSDQEMDTTTALRFHPLEVVLSAFYKVIILILINPRLESFFIYEVLLNSFALFNHSNIRIPKKLDQFLRLFIVTPNMHYPHHSLKSKQMNMNYGNILSIWDRLFKSYTKEENSTFGINEYDKKMSAKDVLFMPFR